MNKIIVLSILTLREAIRDRILYLLLIFAIILVLVSSIISKLTVGDEMKIIKDFGLTTIAFFSMLIAIFLGIGLLYKEIDRKTIYVILSKPIERYQFILGKFFGLLLTLFVNWIIMSIIFCLLIIAKGGWDSKLLWALLTIYLELFIITSVAILFSSFSTPILSAILSLSIYFIGHFIEGLKMLEKKIQTQFLQNIILFFYYLLPNLERFNLRGVVVHGDNLSELQIFYSFIYAIFYALTLLLISIAIFRKRNFI